MRFVAGVVLALLTCGAAQSWWLRLGPGPARKGESNYCSSLGRLQRAASNRTAEVALVGSSLTGRLPATAEVMNLGVDGGTGGRSLRLLKSGAFRVPQTVVVEANLIRAGMDCEDEMGAGEMVRGLWFAAGRVVPELAADARPSSMLYDRLRVRMTEGGGPPASQGVVPQMRAVVPQTAPDLAGVDAAQIERLRAVADELRAMREAGYRVLLVWLPNGVGSKGMADELVRYSEWVAATAGVPFLDLRSLEKAGQIVYTDQVHLSADSAALVWGRIREELTRRH